MINGPRQLTAADILAVLECRYAPPEWVFFRELRLGTGYGGKHNKWERRLDAWAINCYPSKGLLRVAFEVKITRSDFLAELKQPEKRQQGMEVSNLFYFVTPKGLVRSRDELPTECGLIEVVDGVCRQRWSPWSRDCPPPPWRFVASLARRVQSGTKQQG